MVENVLKKHIIVKTALTLIVPNCKAQLRALMHKGIRKKKEIFRKGRKWTDRRNVSTLYILIKGI